LSTSTQIHTHTYMHAHIYRCESKRIKGCQFYQNSDKSDLGFALKLCKAMFLMMMMLLMMMIVADQSSICRDRYIYKLLCFCFVRRERCEKVWKVSEKGNIIFHLPVILLFNDTMVAAYMCWSLSFIQGGEHVCPPTITWVSTKSPNKINFQLDTPCIRKLANYLKL
jgi:hypothetical protein